jgi:hypothetical protein
MSILDRFRRRPKRDDDLSIVKRDDLEDLSMQELEEREQLLVTRIRQRQLELAELELQNTRYTNHRNQREMLIEHYLQEIRALETKLWKEKGEVLRSIQPQEGDDPELVAEAWRIFCAEKRGTGSRF